MALSPESVGAQLALAETLRAQGKDEPALAILADLLNGRTGRLYKSLVLEQGLANSASAGVEGRKYEGYFELRGVAKPGKTPEEVEAAIVGPKATEQHRDRRQLSRPTIATTCRAVGPRT